MIKCFAIASRATFTIGARAPPRRACAPLRVMTYNIRLAL